ncbi:hypothetical protein EJ06DRAFT_552014 [Trichodelitschia bisporula]|uniref:Uncharacterized protein n=1 Tax=Trichodelitschia bisporula TaxID=703511 RepID=A0A6G1HJ16_9PEZI|nr:hypothetical protein EJ06DRAFT_552014 [Trichodelitschia bisporula]
MAEDELSTELANPSFALMSSKWTDRHLEALMMQNPDSHSRILASSLVSLVLYRDQRHLATGLVHDLDPEFPTIVLRRKLLCVIYGCMRRLNAKNLLILVKQKRVYLPEKQAQDNYQSLEEVFMTQLFGEALGCVQHRAASSNGRTLSPERIRVFCLTFRKC